MMMMMMMMKGEVCKLLKTHVENNSKRLHYEMLESLFSHLFYGQLPIHRDEHA